MNKLFVLVFTFCLQYCFPDDSFLGSQGGNIYPQKSTTIKMVEEYVTINLSKTGGDVHCKFWFVNSGDGDTAYVGFPDYTSGPGGTYPLSEFKTWVNGKMVEVFKKDSITDTIGSNSKGPIILSKNWFYWKNYFPKNDTVLIENSYKGKFGFNYCEKYFDYIIGTGNNWAGPIGKGRIVFHHGNLCSNLFVGLDTLKRHCHLKPTFFYDSTVFEFTNYTPKDNEIVSLMISSYWDNTSGWGCPGVMMPVSYFEKKQEMVNEIFARCGHIFTKKKINNYYLQKAWYKPIRKLRLEDLAPEMQKYITIITSR